MKAFTKRSKHRRPVAFLLNKASLASFVLYFYKKVKTKEACGVPFKDMSVVTSQSPTSGSNNA